MSDKVVSIFGQTDPRSELPPPGQEVLISGFNTRGTKKSPTQSWKGYAMYRQADGRIRCEKTAGVGDEPATSFVELIVANEAEARRWFGGGWVIKELFKVYPGGRRAQEP